MAETLERLSFCVISRSLMASALLRTTSQIRPEGTENTRYVERSVSSPQLGVPSRATSMRAFCKVDCKCFPLT
eukprot:scaffold21012_cov29-Tisochrysis_lutea.AAC.2